MTSDIQFIRNKTELPRFVIDHVHRKGGSIVEYPSVEAFLARHETKSVECVILEIDLPRIGLKSLYSLSALPAMPEVIIAATAPGCADVMAALDAGASSVVEVPFDAAILLARLTRAWTACAHRNQDMERCAAARLLVDRLTERELTVAEMVCNGLSSKQIGRALGISIRTVEGHRTHVMRKLEVNSLVGMNRVQIQARFEGGHCDWCRDTGSRQEGSIEPSPNGICGPRKVASRQIRLGKAENN